MKLFLWGLLAGVLLVAGVDVYAIYRPVFGWAVWTPNEMENLQRNMMNLWGALQACRSST